MVGSRFVRAVDLASEWHAGQKRKGTEVPYIAHLLGVASLVLEAGGDEELAIAALLHDAVEDQGGQETLKEIRRRYGKRVARIVAACSDTDQLPKPPWRERKEAFVRRLRTEPYSVRLVVAADKLHNVRDVLSSYRFQGEDLWSHFNGRRDGILWYYRAVVDALVGAAKPGENRLQAIIDEIDRTLAALQQLMAEQDRTAPATGIS